MTAFSKQWTCDQMAARVARDIDKEGAAHVIDIVDGVTLEDFQRVTAVTLTDARV